MRRVAKSNDRLLAICLVMCRYYYIFLAACAIWNWRLHISNWLGQLRWPLWLYPVRRTVALSPDPMQFDVNHNAIIIATVAHTHTQTRYCNWKNCHRISITGFSVEDKTIFAIKQSRYTLAAYVRIMTSPFDWTGNVGIECGTIDNDDDGKTCRRLDEIGASFMEACIRRRYFVSYNCADIHIKCGMVRSVNVSVYNILTECSQLFYSNRAILFWPAAWYTYV